MKGKYGEFNYELEVNLHSYLSIKFVYESTLNPKNSGNFFMSEPRTSPIFNRLLNMPIGRMLPLLIGAIGKSGERFNYNVFEGLE